jgi:uncharacterized protein YndB with AHSA1/START domain
MGLLFEARVFDVLSIRRGGAAGRRRLLLYEERPRRFCRCRRHGCVRRPSANPEVHFTAALAYTATRRLHMNDENTDRIEKTVRLRAPRSRVWRALTDAREFGTWFRVALEGQFAVGQPIRGRITYPGYEHLTMEVTVERMEPERLFSYRWHPGAAEPEDPAAEPTTLVEFRLEDAPDGTILTVVESGFDQLPPERRDEAFRENEEGWAIQMENIRSHVDG